MLKKQRAVLVPLIGLLVFALPTVSNAQSLFTPAAGSPFATGGGVPFGLAVGDFNGDGKPDLAITNSSALVAGVSVVADNVTVLLSNGSGGFTPAPGSPFATGAGPYGVAVGDFNGDGKLDLAVTNANGASVTVLLGNGAGSFVAAPGSPYATGSLPQGLAVGDFNGDGRLDLAINNAGGNSVTVLLGNGTGGFAASGSPYPTGGAGPFGLAVGDFNGDGKLDLAIANEIGNTVTVLLGNGSGGFTPANGSPFAAGTSPDGVVAADFNRDGKLDLAIPNETGNTVTVLLGNGSGGFIPANGSPFATAGVPGGGVAVADFNGDGKPDLALTDLFGNNLTVLLGNGSGGFAPAAGSPFATGASPGPLVVGDFNGDGKPDIAIGNLSSNNMTVLLNTSGQGQITYFFPQIAIGNGFQTVLTYVNFSPVSVTCTTSFVADSGTPLGVPFPLPTGTVPSRVDTLLAGQSLHVQTNASLTAPVSPGWAQGVCTGPVQATTLYRLYQNGLAVGEAGVNGSTVPATKFVTFAETNTGIALGNPSLTQSATVTLTAVSTLGVKQGTGTVTLSPGGHKALNLAPFLGIQSFTGYVEISSDIPIVSLSLNAEAFPVFSSLPPGDLPASAQFAIK